MRFAWQRGGQERVQERGQGQVMDRDKLLREFSQKELKVLQENLSEPIMESMKKRGLNQREIDSVLTEVLGEWEVKEKK